MPDVNVEFYQGKTSGIGEVALVDGQILFDTEAHKILLDTYIDGVLTRLVMTEQDTFTGTTAQWLALTDEQKAVFKYVQFTDDYESISNVMTGATAQNDGIAGLVPKPMAGDQNKVLKGDATWGDFDASNVEYNNAESGLDADNIQDAMDELNTNINEMSSDFSEFNTKLNEVDESINEVSLNLDEVDSKLDTHIANKNNPHEVTAAQIGLENVDNTADLDKPISTSTQSALDGKVDKVVGKGLSSEDFTTLEKTKLNNIENGAEANVQSDWEENNAASDAYIVNKPTLGTAAAKDVATTGNANSEQVVLGNDTRLSDARPASDVSAWAKESEKPTYTASEVGAISVLEKGVSYGVAELDSEGKVPSSQLPGFVDSILEYDSFEDFPLMGETGIIYVAKDTNKTYRWGGSIYVATDDSIALGETSSTAYRGDRGKIAYDHSQTTVGNPHNVTKSDVGLGNVDNTSDLNKPISTATQTALDEKVDKVANKRLSTEDYTTAEKEKLNGIESGASANVQSDWAENDNSSDAYIANKPNLGSAALKDTPESGDASASQVVLGSDSRLTDSRPASDVPLWAKEPTKPTYTATEVGAIDAHDVGTPNGVASLDENGKIITDQLPSDIGGGILEYDSRNEFPLEGNSGVLYVAKDTEKLYRWDGADYVAVSAATTKEDIGLDNVDNTSDLDKPVSIATQAALDDKVDKVEGKSLSTEDFTTSEKTKLEDIENGAQANVQSDWDEEDTESDAYIANKPTLGTAAERDVPELGNATSEQVVLGKDTRLTDSRPALDVYPWAKAYSKPTYTVEEIGAISALEKGEPSGVAELDENGKVPSSQLPGFVDNILEFDTITDFPEDGDSGVIYIAKDTNRTYRWGGNTYVEISESLALGETSSTAYRGDKGKVAYDHATETDRLATAQESGFYKIATTAQGHVASVTPVVKSDITSLGVPDSDTTYDVVSKQAPGLVPALPDDTATSKYFRQDGVWSNPFDTLDKSLSSTSTNGVQNKAIRAAIPFNLGIRNNAYGYFKEDGVFVDFKSQADIDSAVAAAKVGTAGSEQVLSGYTFTNASTSGLPGAIGNATISGATNANDGYTASIAAKKYTGASGSSVTVTKASISGAVNSNDGYTASIAGGRYTGANGSSVTINKVSVTGAAQSDGTFKYSIAANGFTGSNGSSGTISKLTPSYSSGSSQSSLKAGGTATLPAGTYNKNSYTITAASLASQTGVDSGKTAINSDAVKAGYQGWVNGVKVDGSLSLTGNAGNDNVLSGKTFYNNSFTKQTGTMSNNGTIPTQYLNCGESYTIPAGYHSGSGKVVAKDLTSQTGVDSGYTGIVSSHVVKGHQGWVWGSQVTGALDIYGTTADEQHVLDGKTYFSKGVNKKTGIMPNRGTLETTMWPNQALGHDPNTGGTNNTPGYYSNIYIQSKAMTEVWTPTGDNLNNIRADMGVDNLVRYVNTTPSYNAGFADGRYTGKQRQKYYGKVELYTDKYTDGGNPRFPFTVTANNGKFFWVCILQQTSGTYSGVGEGAFSHATGLGVINSSTNGIEQLGCQSDNTTGLGGMVMRSFGSFEVRDHASMGIDGDTSDIEIWMVTMQFIQGYACCYLWGEY